SRSGSTSGSRQRTGRGSGHSRVSSMPSSSQPAVGSTSRRMVPSPREASRPCSPRSGCSAFWRSSVASTPTGSSHPISHRGCLEPCCVPVPDPLPATAAGTWAVAVPLLLGCMGLLWLHFASPPLAITWSFAHLQRDPGLLSVGIGLVVVLPPLVSAL